MTAAGGLAFTAAVRMIDRVHRNAAVVRTTSSPTRAACLADGYVFVIGVAYLPDGGAAIEQYFAGFARRQLHQRIVAFLGNQLRGAAGGAHHLRTLAGTQLEIVNRRA